MNIAVKGSAEQTEELNELLSSAGLKAFRFESSENIRNASPDIIFDLNFDSDPSLLDEYINTPDTCLLLLGSVKIQLESILPETLWRRTAGINALPGFINRSALEYCTADEKFPHEKLKELGWKELNRCASRVGLVSPRVVFMIINEAFFTVQEGTASREDIDLGMKLGTAYPMGPFEWCEKAGIENVYETLSALYEDTRDERYKICSLLKTEYLRKRKTV